MNKKKIQSKRYANGEYAVEHPQVLPIVIAEITRWVAQNMDLTLK